MHEDGIVFTFLVYCFSLRRGENGRCWKHNNMSAAANQTQIRVFYYDEKKSICLNKWLFIIKFHNKWLRKIIINKRRCFVSNRYKVSCNNKQNKRKLRIVQSAQDTKTKPRVSQTWFFSVAGSTKIKLNGFSSL
jgi:hypothetical protein